ncbi:MAG: hypothetical protein U0003_05385 [Vampirovibrionales bacterium]
MSYKNDSFLVILDKYSTASSAAKADLFETYDRIRDLTVSGSAMGGGGTGKFFGVLTNLAKMFGSSAFNPTMGNESMTIPGTSYFSPITGGTGIVPGGQASFGLSPFAQVTGFPNGAAANVDAVTGGVFAGGAAGLGSPIGQAVLAGGAGPIGTLATAGALGAGTTAAATGMGRNWVLPAAGVVSGIGGLLTTLGPFFGPFGLAAAAGGALMNGAAGAVLSSYQSVSNRILVNADTILSNRVRNLETTIKQLDAQNDIVKKLMKEMIDGEKKALDNL